MATEIEKIQADKTTTAVIAVIPGNLEAAQSISITDDESNKNAINLVRMIQDQAKQVDLTRKTWVEPHNNIVKSVNDYFRGPIEMLKKAEEIVKGKLLAYSLESARKAEEERLKILKQAESNRIKPETAIKKLAAVEEVKNTTKTDEGSAVTFSIVKKVVVNDESKLPREYLVPSLPLIEAALKAGKVVPGAQIVEEKVPRIRRTY